MKGLFITGTDTGIGKTVLSAVLMAAAPNHVVYWKPVQTGTGESDTASVIRLAGLSKERVLDEGCRFATPASPHHAAAIEGDKVALSSLVGLGRRRDTPATRWIVEGVGGLLVPLSATVLLPDLIQALGLPVLVASSTRLGTINHTLLTLSELERRRFSVLGIILMGPEDESGRTGIEQHAWVPVLARVEQIEPLESAALRSQGEALLRLPAIREALA